MGLGVWVEAERLSGRQTGSEDLRGLGYCRGLSLLEKARRGQAEEDLSGLRVRGVEGQERVGGPGGTAAERR